MEWRSLECHLLDERLPDIEAQVGTDSAREFGVEHVQQ